MTTFITKTWLSCTILNLSLALMMNIAFLDAASGSFPQKKRPPVDTSSVKIKLFPNKVIQHTAVKNLLGTNIAIYNKEREFDPSVQAHLNALNIGLIRMPGGSVSDKFYWNGNGVVTGRTTVDQSKYHEGYWQVDFSDYKPGFVVDNRKWWQAFPHYVHFDAKSMHEVTQRHPIARNLVTVNAGTGTAEMAAEWVRWANKTNDYNVEYWEIGNELNGQWEAGHYLLDGSTMTAEIYAKRYLEFAKAMKAVDPSIKIGGPACDITHSDYNTTLLNIAGEYVDFISVHSYSIRDSLTPKSVLFEKPREIENMVEILDQQIKNTVPERLGQIEYSITEWNSKLPQDEDSYTMFNGLWFSAYVGEMFRQGIDSATMWDTFSKDPKGGHGLLYGQDGSYVPTARYWAFWLWSHHMGDRMIEAKVDEPSGVYTFATLKDGKIHLMVVNSSETEQLNLDLDWQNTALSKSVELVQWTSKDYFFNPHAKRIEWNNKPQIQNLRLSNTNKLSVPPYSVSVFKFDPVKSSDLKLKVVVPSLWPHDTELPIQVLVCDQNGNSHSSSPLATAKVSVQGPATSSTNLLNLQRNVAHFSLKAQQPGEAIIKVQAGETTVQQTVTFQNIEHIETPVWAFDRAEQLKGFESSYQLSDQASPMSIKIEKQNVVEQKNVLFKTHQMPKKLNGKAYKQDIGGLMFDLKVDANFTCEDAEANIVLAMQADGAYWIPMGSVKLMEHAGQWQQIRIEMPNKDYLRFMHKTFSIYAVLNASSEVAGEVQIRNLGFLSRKNF